MNISKDYAEYAAEKALELISIDSPTGFCQNATAWVYDAFTALGYEASYTNKGAVLVSLGGAENAEEGALLLECHADTLGAMVAEIKGNGRLRLTNLGGLPACNITTENARVYTHLSDKVFEGTVQLKNASSHVNGDLSKTERTYDTVELVLDEPVESAEDVRKLGIAVGDIVCVDPRSRITESGYIKSRFLDDKLSVGIVLAFAKFLKDKALTPSRPVYAMITTYEEVGHGGSAGIPADVKEALSIDMGCVGDGLTCTERMCSICAKDSGGPYDYSVVDRLIKAAKAEQADYAVDIYPHYGSDVEATVKAGYDVRHGLIGSGVYASHGYERSHIDGVYATLKVLKGFLEL